MPTLKTPSDIIQIAKLSQFYASDAIGNGSLFTPELNPQLAKILYVERKSLEWMYDLDSADSTLQNVANYVYRMCGRYGLKAAATLSGGAGGGGGTIVTPTTPTTGGFSFVYLIPITAANFANATDYNDQRIAGKQVEVFWKNVQNYQTTYGWQIIYTPTGFTVFVDDGAGNNAFNALTTNSDALFDIYIVNPTGTTTSGNVPLWLYYTAVGGETSITNTALVGATMGAVLRGTALGIIPSGTPAVGQVLFTSSTGRLDFNSGSPLIADELIAINYTPA